MSNCPHDHTEHEPCVECLQAKIGKLEGDVRATTIQRDNVEKALGKADKRIDEQTDAILNANHVVAGLTQHVTALECTIEDYKNKLRMIKGLCEEEVD